MPPSLDPDTIGILGEVALINFAADPQSLKPTQATTLTWQVGVPENTPGLNILLNNFRVPPSGTQQLQMLEAKLFVLEVVFRGLRTTLGSVHVAVDYSECMEFVLREDDLRGDFQFTLEQFIKTTVSPIMSTGLREPVRLHIDTAGIALTLRLEVGGTDLDIDFVLNLLVDRGVPKAFFTRFSLDLDVPWYADVFSFGLAPLLLEAFEGSAEDALKPQILAAFDNRLKATLALAPAGSIVGRIRTLPGELVVTLCKQIDTSIQPVDLIRSILFSA